MNAFPDIAADFMRLDAELFRAARLVVDTGLHAKGWTEDQAVEYMNTTGRQPIERSRSEIRRYITLPGQATGYKMGMLKIVELRQKAEKALGPKFDINLNTPGTRLRFHPRRRESERRDLDLELAEAVDEVRPHPFNPVFRWRRSRRRWPNSLPTEPPPWTTGDSSPQVGETC